MAIDNKTFQDALDAFHKQKKAPININSKSVNEEKSQNVQGNTANTDTETNEERKETLSESFAKAKDKFTGEYFSTPKTAVGQTLTDAYTKVTSGAIRSVEGIIDAAVGLGGRLVESGVHNFVGTEEGQKVADWTSNFIKKNLLTTPQDDINRLYGQSNNNAHVMPKTLLQGKVGNVVGQGFETIGEMLPAIAVGGLGGATLGSATFFGSAMGGSTEQALNEGANFEDAVNYGMLSGGVELLTEKMFGLIGGGFLGKTADTAINSLIRKNVSSTIGRAAIKTAVGVVGEGIEEVVSEMVNPLLKNITYSKNEKIDWTAVKDSFIAGATTALMFGAANVVNGQRGAIQENMQELEYTQNKQNQSVAQGNVTKAETYKKLSESITSEVSSRLQKLDSMSRQNTIKKIAEGGIDWFNEDGTINTNKFNNSQDIAQRMLATVKGVQANFDITSLDDAKRTELAKTVAFYDAISKTTKDSPQVKFYETLGRGINGYYDRRTNTIRISKNADSMLEVLKHEFAHSVEKTAGYTKLQNYVIEDLKASGEYDKLFEATQKLYKSQIKNLTQEELDQYINEELVAQYSEKLFTDQKAINKLYGENESLFRKIHKWIKERLGMLKGKLSKNELDAKKRLEKIEDMYVKAIKEENEVTSNISEDELKYGLKKDRYEVIDDFIMSKKEVSLDLNGSKIVASIDENTLKKNFRIPINSTNAGFNAKIRHYKEFHSIIEGSSYIKTMDEKNNNKNKYHKNIDKWHLYKNEVKDNNGMYSILTYISETNKQEYRVYEQVWGKIKNQSQLSISQNNIGDTTSGKSLVTGYTTTIHQNNNVVNTNDEKSSKNDVKYSLEDKTLVALHNLDEVKLMSTLELGGFPMPSIAITKAERPHEDYGNITVVFNKETIDPSYYKNKVWSGDKWTPTFPRVEVDIDESKLMKLYGNVNKWNAENGRKHNTVSLHHENIKDSINNLGIDKTIKNYAQKELIIEYARSLEGENVNVEEWFAKQLYAAVKNKGIRNGADQFTKSGNRKSFWALHYPFTLENIVKAMEDDYKKDSFIATSGSIKAQIMGNYESIKDIKKDSNKIVDGEKYKAERDELDATLSKLAARVYEIIKPVNSTYGFNEFVEFDNAVRLIETMAKKPTKTNIQKNIDERNYNKRKYDVSLINDIFDFFNKLNDSSVKYFEAKPQRVVGFDEISKIILPKDTSNDLIKQIEKRNIRYEFYGDGKTRTDIIKESDDIKFSLTVDDYVDREIDMNGEEYLKQLRLAEEELEGIDDPIDKYRNQIENLIYDELDSQIDSVIEDIDSDIESYVAKIGDGNLEYELETSRSTQAGRYPSRYIKITNQNDETLEIRLSDGHENSVGGSTEHTFIDLIDDYSYEFKSIKEEIKRWYNSLNDTTSDNDDIKYSLQMDKELELEEIMNPFATQKIRRWSETSKEVSFLAKEDIEGIKKYGEKYYTPISNKATNEKAVRNLGNYQGGNIYNAAITYLENVRSGKSISAVGIAEGELLLMEAYKQQNFSVSEEIVRALASVGTELGQSVQALAMIKRMTPEGKLMTLERSVERLNSKKREISNKQFKEVVEKRMETYAEQEKAEVTSRIVDAMDSIIKVAGVENVSEDATTEIKSVIKNEMKNIKNVEQLTDFQKSQIESRIKTILDKRRYKNSEAMADSITKEFYKTLDLSLKNLLKRMEADTIFIPTELKKEFLEAKSKEDQEAVLDKISTHIAKEMPGTLWEKLNAWRYLAMLGNAKTHIRNFTSNIIMGMVATAKNNIARSIETITQKVGLLDEKQRTRTFKKAPQYIVDFTKTDTIEMKGRLQNNDKYNIGVATKGEIQSKRKIFKSKSVEWFRKFNFSMLEAEDWFMIKRIYQKTMAEYMTAQNFTKADLMNNVKLEEARAYAIREAQYMTFRSFSKFASDIQRIKARSKINEFLIGGALPFTTTPINILKVGIDFSPIGLVKTITLDTKRFINKDITANEWIDNVSKGLTGTLITVLGYILAKLGIVSTEPEKDPKASSYLGQLGTQRYSITIGGYTATLDWLSPSAMPLFTGAKLFDLIENNESTSPINALVEFPSVLLSSLDPITDMSLLSGLNNLLSNYSDNRLSQTVYDTLLGYIKQAIPTALRQVARSLDENVRVITPTNFGNIADSKELQKTLNDLVNKIPFLSYMLEPKIDVWGNEIKDKNWGLRIAENMFLPFWVEDTKTTKVDDEILNLYYLTDDNSIIPNTYYNSYFTVDSIKYELTASEFTEYKKNRGSYSYKTLESLFASKEYTNMTQDEKIKAISKVYNQAHEYAKNLYLESIKGN